MPKFKVEMARVTWLTATVEADSEEEALDKARELTPDFSAHDSGWGHEGWTAGADEWLPLDEFYSAFGKYDVKLHGPVFEMVNEDEEG